VEWEARIQALDASSRVQEKRLHEELTKWRAMRARGEVTEEELDAAYGRIGARETMFDKAPPVDPERDWLLSEFWELPRDGWSGALSRIGMDEILIRDYGVSDRIERRRCRSLWREMNERAMAILHPPEKTKPRER
jgi:hypothetical protein